MKVLELLMYLSTRDNSAENSGILFEDGMAILCTPKYIIKYATEIKGADLSWVKSQNLMTAEEMDEVFSKKVRFLVEDDLLDIKTRASHIFEQKMSDLCNQTSKDEPGVKALRSALIKIKVSPWLLEHVFGIFKLAGAKRIKIYAGQSTLKLESASVRVVIKK